jgi:hypothetical protein
MTAAMGATQVENVPARPRPSAITGAPLRHGMSRCCGGLITVVNRSLTKLAQL